MEQEPAVSGGLAGLSDGGEGVGLPGGIVVHIVFFDLIHAYIVAPVPAEGGRFPVLRHLDPELVQLLLTAAGGLVDAAAAHQVLDLLHVPDPDNALLIGADHVLFLSHVRSPPYIP